MFQRKSVTSSPSIQVADDVHNENERRITMKLLSDSGLRYTCRGRVWLTQLAYVRWENLLRLCKSERPCINTVYLSDLLFHLKYRFWKY